MHIYNLDLRTLAVFSSVLRTHNLSATAELMGLSQPAVSQTMARLRSHFGDVLFVRTAHGMTPTPRALELKDAVEEILAIAQGRLDPHAAFDPLVAERKFTFFATDFGATVFLPRLVASLRERAPGIGVRAVTASAQTVKQQLESGAVDLAIGGFTELGSGFYQQLLYRDSHVCIAGTRFDGGERLSKASFRAASHAVVGPLPPGYTAVEELLRSELAPGHIALEVPNFLSLLMILRETDLLCTVPRKVGVAVAALLGLRTYAPPFSLPMLSVTQFWHERLHSDPGHRWMRSLFVELFRNAH